MPYDAGNSLLIGEPVIGGTPGNALVIDAQGNLSDQAFPAGIAIGDPVSGGTSKSILYVDASGNLAQNNANLQWDDANTQLLLANGSVSRPVFSFAGDVDTGVYNVSSNTVGLSAGGSLRAGAGLGYLCLTSGTTLSWSNSTTVITSGQDVILTRDASAVFAQKNSGVAQTHRIYNTTTGNERLSLGWSGNVCTIQSENGSRDLKVQAGGTYQCGGGAAVQWQIPSTGHLTAITDNNNDIGQSGANRPRNIYAATAVQVEADQGLRLTNQTDGAAAAVGTLTNAPAAGDPVIWAPIFVNGNLRHFPCW